MKLSIYGKDITVTAAIKKYVETKIGRVEKFHDGIINLDVYLAAKKVKTGNFVKVDALAYLEGTTIKCTKEDSDLYAAVDVISDMLERQLRKKKEKGIKAKQSKEKVTKHLHYYEVAAETTADGQTTEENDGKNVVKVLLPPKPMAVDEAILQLEAMDRVFYAFVNIRTGRMNVVYKRKDGDYGYIES
ncbi:MAG: ribosome-associated translation inhibitor RaiA [Fusobacteriaceae bacterium]|jgi:putative sigma-54 modulation protein|nr:ribosome-associated translation inhibitor RaiA [Fusobacteriaceae bacterium]